MSLIYLMKQGRKTTGSKYALDSGGLQNLENTTSHVKASHLPYVCNTCVCMFADYHSNQFSSINAGPCSNKLSRITTYLFSCPV